MAASVRVGTPRGDDANQCIWWGDRRVDLTPKAFLVLRRLMQQPSQIVTKHDLLDAAWPDTHVSDGVLALAINQLREALGDDARQPRFIETVHRRGYAGSASSRLQRSAAERVADRGMERRSVPRRRCRSSGRDALARLLAL
jgi:DNA-binding winged helix-turn-helix (wHTH) protein